MSWVEIKLRTPSELKDSMINRLFELGASGVTEGEGEFAGLLSAYFSKDAMTSVQTELSAYTASLKELFPKLPMVTWETVDVVSQNWSESYKEFYKAQKMTNHFFLKPAWDKVTPVPGEMIPIIMEPGQAFGTGLHPTTRLTMRLLESAINLYPRVSDMSVLDVGTGTGILAIAASKLGISKVTGIDNDPLATDAALENCKLNDCSTVTISGEDLNQIAGPFTVILSNILLDTHDQLKAEYQRLLAPRGQLILSGILVNQRQALCKMMLEEGFVENSWEALEEWAAVCFHRN
jgi:ribosomal protein L11 methyltransferase